MVPHICLHENGGALNVRVVLPCVGVQEERVAARVQSLLSTPRFRCYRTTDVIGVELGKWLAMHYSNLHVTWLGP
jgi:hypothetical protein